MSDPTRNETCNLGNSRSDNFGEAWCHTHNVAAAGHFGSAEPVDWREMFLQVGQKWTALLEHLDLAEDATADDVLLAPSTTSAPAAWIELAADIRAVDGNHDLGAGELAEALIERGWTRRSTP